MKKIISLLICILSAMVLFGCGAHKTEVNIAGNTYTYEKPGIGGNFTITVNDDGTFDYYEGSLSSYYAHGVYTIDGDTFSIVDGDGCRTNNFKIEDNQLTWIADGSDNFIYVTVADGAVFKLNSK